MAGLSNVSCLPEGTRTGTKTKHGQGLLSRQGQNLLPVSVLHSWVAGNAEDGKVLLELLNLQFDILCQASGCRHINEGLGQLIYHSPHISCLLRDFLSIQ